MQDMLQYLLPLLKWLSSGPVGIIAGIVGMGAVGTAVALFFKKVRETKFNNTLNDSAASAGKISEETSTGMKANTALGEDWAKKEQERIIKEQVRLTCPDLVPVSTLFEVKLTGVASSKMLYADKTWELGFIEPGRVRTVLLNTAGERTLDVKVGDTWVSKPVTIK